MNLWRSVASLGCEPSAVFQAQAGPRHHTEAAASPPTRSPSQELRR